MLDYLEKKGFAKDIKKQFTYVTKLYNEEIYVLASKSVTSISQLNGKKVSVDLPNGDAFVTAAVEAVARARFDEFLKQSPVTAATVRTDTERETLFKQFQAREAECSAKAQAHSQTQR